MIFSIPSYRIQLNIYRFLCYNKNMDSVFINHLKDLSQKADRNNRYTFTGFLTEEEQSELFSIKKELLPFTLFGGAPGCQRVIARFGDADELGYEEDFPIACLFAKPTLKKFSDELTHRDFLGALMHLGIERSRTGDIVLRENAAYLFVHTSLALYISENLTKVKHTVITCTPAPTLPEGALFQLADETLIVSSLRLDCLIAALYKLSRAACCELFQSKKIFINGRLCENTSYTPKSGDTVSVRGFGRFIFQGETGRTKKDRLCVKIQRYL